MFAEHDMACLCFWGVFPQGESIAVLNGFGTFFIFRISFATVLCEYNGKRSDLANFYVKVGGRFPKSKQSL